MTSTLEAKARQEQRTQNPDIYYYSEIGSLLDGLVAGRGGGDEDGIAAAAARRRKNLPGTGPRANLWR